MPKVIQVIESVKHVGNGQDDPYRNVMCYHTLEGEPLAEYDNYIMSEKLELERRADEIVDLHKFFVGVRDLVNRSISGDRTVSADPTPPQVFIDVRELLVELADFRLSRGQAKTPPECGPEPDRN